MNLLENVVLGNSHVQYNVVLSCTADANPMPPNFITWEKVGSTDFLPSVYSDASSTLTLRSITRDQAGPYRCRGDNGVPPVVYSSDINVIVHCKQMLEYCMRSYSI